MIYWPSRAAKGRKYFMRINLSALTTKIAVTLLFLGAAFATAEAFAQQLSDMEKVKAASKAFFTALNARDPSAMAKVYAHTPYVVHIDPSFNKGIFLGWEAVNKSWENLHNETMQINVSFSETGEPQIVGTLAWEVGTEKGVVITADGKRIPIEAFVTNIYQNIDGHWLLVSHQAAEPPKYGVSMQR
jgi:ketosteroid isomerase-like protein